MPLMNEAELQSAKHAMTEAVKLAATGVPPNDVIITFLLSLNLDLQHRKHYTPAQLSDFFQNHSVKEILEQADPDVDWSAYGVNQTSTLATYLNQHIESMQDPFRNSILSSLLVNETYNLFIEYLTKNSTSIEPNSTDSEGKTLLSMAAKMNKADMVQLILQQHYVSPLDINCADNAGRTALHYAYAYGNERMVKCLLGAGADSSLVDSQGNTTRDCLNLPINEIKTMLSELQINPDRDANAQQNETGLPDSVRTLLSLRVVDIGLEPDCPFMVNTAHNFDTLIDVLNDSYDIDTNTELQNEVKNYEQIKAQYSGESLIESIVRGRKLLSEQSNSDLHLNSEDDEKIIGVSSFATMFTLMENVSDQKLTQDLDQTATQGTSDDEIEVHEEQSQGTRDNVSPPLNEKREEGDEDAAAEDKPDEFGPRVSPHK